MQRRSSPSSRGRSSTWPMSSEMLEVDLPARQHLGEGVGAASPRSRKANEVSRAAKVQGPVREPRGRGRSPRRSEAVGPGEWTPPARRRGGAVGRPARHPAPRLSGLGYGVAEADRPPGRGRLPGDRARRSGATTPATSPRASPPTASTRSPPTSPGSSTRSGSSAPRWWATTGAPSSRVARPGPPGEGFAPGHPQRAPPRGHAPPPALEARAGRRSGAGTCSSSISPACPSVSWPRTASRTRPACAGAAGNLHRRGPRRSTARPGRSPAPHRDGELVPGRPALGGDAAAEAPRGRRDARPVGSAPPLPRAGDGQDERGAVRRRPARGLRESHPLAPA